MPESKDYLLHYLIINRQFAAAADLIAQGNWYGNFRGLFWSTGNYYTGVYNANGLTALQLACILGYDQLVTLMLANKVDPHQFTREGLPPFAPLALINQPQYGAWYEPYEKKRVAHYTRNINAIINQYVRLGVDVNAQAIQTKQTALHFAAGIMPGRRKAPHYLNKLTPNRLESIANAGHIAVVRGLLANGADCDVRDIYGLTPLCYAAGTRGNAHVVKALIAAGADLNVVDNFNNSPLHFAAANGCIDVVNALLENNPGLDLNIVNEDQQTPLLIACKEMANQTEDRVLYERIVLALIQAHAEVNVKDQQNITPLHWAGARGMVNVINALIAAGADINAVDVTGNTPQIAHAQGMPLQEEARKLYFHTADEQDVFITPENNLIYKFKMYWDRNINFGWEPFNIEEHYDREPPEYENGRIIRMPVWLAELRARARPERLDAAPVVLNPAPVIYNQVNTHAESIHKSVTDSALMLKQKYQAFLGKVKIDSMPLFLQEYLPAIIKVIAEELDEEQIFTRDNEKIKEQIMQALAYVGESNFVDPVSRIKLAEIFQIVRTAIALIKVLENKVAALSKLLAYLYIAMDETVCEPGFFNKIVYSQQGMLPEVNVIIQDKAHARAAWINKMKQFAQSIFEQAGINDFAEFEAEFNKQAQDAALKIVKEVVCEYYLIFRFDSLELAQQAKTETINERFYRNMGVRVSELFADFGLREFYDKVSKKAAPKNTP